MYKNILLLLVVVFTLCPSAFAWKQSGHAIVGEIAENHISATTRKKVRVLLGGGSLGQVASWADEVKVKPKWKHTKTWHFANFPRELGYERSVKNQKGDVIQALKRLTAQLRDRQLSREKRANALKLVVHFMGDLHQPLHLGKEEDLGGNRYKVKWFGKDTNLHSVWDENLIDGERASIKDYVKHIDKPARKKRLGPIEGTFIDWATQAQSFVPGLYPEAEGVNLGYKYLKKHKANVEAQLLRAGLRLAIVLDENL